MLSVDFLLTWCLEELYIPYNLVGVMAQNTHDGNKKEQVWMKNAPQGMQ